jgi:hypothetical protein
MLMDRRYVINDAVGRSYRRGVGDMLTYYCCFRSTLTQKSPFAKGKECRAGKAEQPPENTEFCACTSLILRLYKLVTDADRIPEIVVI